MIIIIITIDSNYYYRPSCKLLYTSHVIVGELPINSIGEFIKKVSNLEDFV